MCKFAVQFIMIFCLSLVGIGCQRTLDSETPGGNFIRQFLHDGEKNVPLQVELQVYLGGQVAQNEFNGLTATLKDEAGNPVPGKVVLNAEAMVLVFIPAQVLMPDTEYTLTVETAGGETFVYHFTTRPPSGVDPPEVAFSGITLIAMSGGSQTESAIPNPPAGVTVSGLIRVEAAVTDNTGLAGAVIGSLEGLDTGWAATEPFYFFINTAGVADGTRTIAVRAMDLDGNQTAQSLQVNVQTNRAIAAPFWILDPFWIFAEGLDLQDGVTLSSPLRAAMVGGVMYKLHAVTDANYTDWEATARVVGEDQGSGYVGYDTFTSPGVPCLQFYNLSGSPWNLPASTLALTMPDHSVLTVSLPARTINNLKQVAFYIAADGSTHNFRTELNSVSFSLPPTWTPSAALANTPDAP